MSDLGIALVAALIGIGGVVLGGALSHWSGVAQQQRERKERRAAVATALLTELPWVERGLRKLTTHTDAALNTVNLTSDAYNRFAPELILFGADTVSVLLRLHAFIRDIEYSKGNFTRVEGPVPEDERDHTHDHVRIKAALAAQLVPQARALFEREGGIPPADPPTEIIPTDTTPQLPPPAFPGASSDLTEVPGGLRIHAAEGDGE